MAGLVQLASLCLLLAGGSALWAQSPDFDRRLSEGRQLRAMGKYHEAEQSFGRLLTEQKQHDPNAAQVAAVLDDLAGTQQDLGNFTGAERLLTDALAILKKAGPNDPYLARVKTHLGEVYIEEGRMLEAEPLLQQALLIRQSLGTSNPVDIAVLKNDLAMVFEHTHRIAKAESLLRQSLQELEAQVGPTSPMVTSALCPLAAVLARRKRYPEALQYTERAWEILRRNPSVAEPDLLMTMGALGSLYSLTGRPEEAEYYAKQAVDRAESIYGPEHPRLGWYLANYALVLKRLNRKTEAKAVQDRSKTILAHSDEVNPVQHSVNVNALR